MDIDLHRHAVFEASAGTGKTHSIEDLVVRLVQEEGVPLDSILIVTFTEKATGELKDRLRKRLEKELRDGSPHRAVLQEAVDCFDQAWIFTLHGFCRRVLQECVVEQGQELRSQLVNDRDLLESCLREIQRRVWRQDYGPQLGQVLTLAGYNRDQAQHWERQVCNLAADLRPECGDRLVPRAIEDWPDILKSIEQKIRQSLPKLRSGIQNLGRPSTNQARRIHHWLNHPATEDQPVRSFHDLLDELSSCAKFRAGGFPGVLPDSKATRWLEKLREHTDWSNFRWQLAVRTVPQLQQALNDYKGQNGQWSFDDMIARVDDSLNPAKNLLAHRLALSLRQRFRYGIVDEFQDTDPLQWRILQRIFLADVRLRLSAQAEPTSAKPQADICPSLLFLVGDPKQAIFGFRGADLPTYQDAVREIINKHGAQECPLTINWRSSPELIDSLNDLFEKGEWFPAADNDIHYRRVEPAPENERPSKLEQDHTGRPALNVVDWRLDERLAILRRQHARFIVDEIGRLLNGSGAGPTQVSIKRQPARPLDAGDICILVFRRKEARPVIAGLKQAGIPFTFYKQPDLWKSDEAEQLRFVLDALCQPEHRGSFRKALLTRFFRCSPEELAQSDELPARHPARQLFERWLELAGRRQWTPLFQSMFEDSRIFAAGQADADGDRERANFRLIAGRLMQQAYRQNLDLLSLAEWYRHQENMGVAEENVQPKETERPRVKIMTIHAAKGLEFPVVFLAGGWTCVRQDKLVTYREDKPGRAFDLTEPGDDSPAKKKAQSERLDEDRRLLYVALTRAMFKLYVPQVLVLDEAKYYSPGPIVHVLAPALSKAGLAPIRAGSVSDGQQPQAVASAKPQAAAWRIDGPLFPPLDADLGRRGIVIRSFTSLHRASGPHETSTFSGEPRRVDDDETDNVAVKPEEQRDPLRGAVFGEIVHGVLEKIDYEAVGKARTPQDLLTAGSATEKVLAEEIEQYLAALPGRLPEQERRIQCRERVAQLTWHALHTPLAELGGPLCDVPRSDRLHEVQFHFPEDESGAVPANTRREEGFITGFIDLVVRRQDRYFLIDWKTNALPGYGPDEVRRAMADNDYFLQYRLYLQALTRWLQRSLGARFTREHSLGGVYYLFLRGLGESTNGAGIFFQSAAGGLALAANER